MVGKNGKDTSPPAPWGWVEQVASVADITRIEMLRAYRINGYRECPYDGRKRPCKCKKNPHCLWGLGDYTWRGEDIDAQEQSQTREEGQIAGLQNQGQTCYVNSLLQLWYHNPILRPAILSWVPPPEMISDCETYTPVCAMSHLQLMFARMKASKQRTIDTISFVSALGLDPSMQQDAEEFAKLLLSCLTRLLENTSSQNLAISYVFKTCFTGTSRFETTCENCRNVTTGRIEEFSELQLSVLPTLEQAFAQYLSEERLENDNQYFCHYCNGKHNAIRQVKLLSLPQVLNIQLMRFVFDPATCEKKKVLKVIKFPDVMDMTGYLHSTQPESNNGVNNPVHTYVLNAVLIHHGTRASSGHYTSHIKDPTSGCWIDCNDDKVETINKKSQSKKLIIKAEENGDVGDSQSSSDNNGSSTTSSKGAYMLVYTRQECFSRVVADPELPKHLTEVIRREDAFVESQQHDAKMAKEAESRKRSERGDEIQLLFANKYPPPDDEEENKKPLDLNSEIQFIASKQPAPRPPPVKNVNSIDFISAAWLELWMKYSPVWDVLPIENEDIVCTHGKLRPPRKSEQSALYKIIPVEVANVLFERHGGKRLSGEDALCKECVDAHFNFLTDLNKLEDDAKKVSEAVKSCDLEYERNGKQLTHDFHSNKFLIGKESLKEWKKHAKNMIEQKEKGELGSQNSQSDWKLNQELLCKHENLSLNKTLRRRINDTGYFLLTPYFEDGIWYGSGEEECHICLQHEENNESVIQQFKQYGADEKAKLNELFRGTHRPTSTTLGTFSLIPVTFFEMWCNFIRNPTLEPPQHIPTNELLCDARTCTCDFPRFKFPFQSLQHGMPVDEKDLFEQVVMVKPSEMRVLLERRSIDVDIQVTIDQDPQNRSQRIYSHSIQVCEQSGWDWINAVVEKKFNYNDDIVIRKIEDEEMIEEFWDQTSANEPELLHIEDDGMPPFKVSRGENDIGLRRSVRRRPSRLDQKYRIYSSTTIREFQIRVLCREHSAGLSDQHLYWNRKELTENQLQMSFAQLRIPPGSILYLKIDKQLPNGDARRDEDVPVKSPPRVERGFIGTALLGAASQPLARTVSAAAGSPSASVAK